MALQSEPEQDDTQDMTTTAAPLSDFRIIGLDECWFKAAPDAPRQPAGSCWHCGAAIGVLVIVKRVGSQQVETIGTTCAERVGMDVTELKQWLADKYREERELARVQRSAEYRAARAAEAAREVELYGEHGTQSRYVAGGCRCELCRAAAPCGTVDRYCAGCQCFECLDAAMADDDRLSVREVDVIVSTTTGEVVEARKVSTRYGYRWCVEEGRAWLPIEPARRTTQTKHGYVEASCAFLVIRLNGQQRGTTWLKPLRQLGSPLVDIFGELVRP